MTGDTFVLMNLAVIVGLLGLIIIRLILYAIIWLPVSHALKSHTRWVDDGKP